MTALFSALLVYLKVAWFAASQRAPLPDHVWFFSSADAQRHAFVYLPEGMPRRVVVFLHGATGEALDGGGPALLRWARANQAALVFPAGIEQRWEVAHFAGSADQKFIQDVQARLQAEFAGVSATLSGFSNGGFATLATACLKPKLFSDYVALAATLATATSLHCAPEAASVTIAAGTADPVVPYGGGEVAGTLFGTILPVEDAARILAARNGCSQFRESSVSGDLPAALRECVNGASFVRLYAVQGAGHHLFGIRRLGDQFGPWSRNPPVGDLFRRAPP